MDSDRFALALQVTTEGHWDWDFKNYRAYLSPRYCELAGYDNKRNPRQKSYSWQDPPKAPKSLCHQYVYRQAQNFSSRDGIYF
jgi:PAS domain-containing protein